MVVAEVSFPFLVDSPLKISQSYHRIIIDEGKGVECAFFPIFPDLLVGTAKFWEVSNVKTLANDNPLVYISSK